MDRRHASKKTSTKIPGEVEDLIVALSLQNPEFGTRRLVPILQQKNIAVSKSTVYNILKRNGLQTRGNRLAKLKVQKIPKLAAPIAKKPPAKISPEIEERIVEVSLQNPEFGARRLVFLLKQEDIGVSASAIYSILKRHDLQSRDKRLAKIAELIAVVSLPPKDVQKLPQPAVAIPIPTEEPEWVPEDIEEKFHPPPILPVSKAPEKAIARRPYIFTLLNLLLLLLLMFLGFYTVQNVSTAGLEPRTVAAIMPPPVNLAAKLKVTGPPLSDYQIIWKRNLFDSSIEKPPAPKKEIALDKIDLAGKDLGLKLMGTVVADDPENNCAIIYNPGTREQGPYFEGDKAGEVVIKKVLRNNVIITTQKGEKLLTVEIEKTQQPSKTDKSWQLARWETSSIPDGQPESDTTSIHLNREEIESFLADIDQLYNEVTILPFTQEDQPSGIRLGRLPPKNILRKMGLRLKDVIVGVNGVLLTEPDQATELFRKLAEGGEITLEIKRRGFTRQIQLNIE